MKKPTPNPTRTVRNPPTRRTGSVKEWYNTPNRLQNRSRKKRRRKYLINLMNKVVMSTRDTRRKRMMCSSIMNMDLRRRTTKKRYFIISMDNTKIDDVMCDEKIVIYVFYFNYIIFNILNFIIF